MESRGGASPAYRGEKLPEIPEEASVTLDPRSAAVLVLDLTDASCGRVPAARQSIPTVRRFIDRARNHGARILFSVGRAAAEVHPGLGRRNDETVVKSSANKFFRTELEERLHDLSHAVVLGTSANGAVLYTSFAACARGLTVVVPVDAISSRSSFATFVAQWQLLNQPGFFNRDNEPLRSNAVTLSRTDKIAFEPSASASNYGGR